VAAAETARDLAAARVAALRSAAEANSKAVSKKADRLSKKAEKRRKELAKAAAKATKDTRKQTHELAQRIGVEKKPRRWPWLLVALGVGGAVFAVVRRSTAADDPWTPAPTGDGPVPAYREDPVPSTDSNPADDSTTETNGGQAVSTAEDAAGDATPESTDLGWRDGKHHDAQSDSPDAAPQVNPVPTEETLNKPPLGRD
jgi:hypothetical protein